MTSSPTPSTTRNWIHLLANPADRPRFEAARISMKGRTGGAVRHADVIDEMLTCWEKLEPLRSLLSAETNDRQLTMPEAAQFLIDHWEDT